MSFAVSLQRVIGRCKMTRKAKNTAPHTAIRYVSLRKWSDVRRVKAYNEGFIPKLGGTALLTDNVPIILLQNYRDFLFFIVVA